VAVAAGGVSNNMKGRDARCTCIHKRGTAFRADAGERCKSSHVEQRNDNAATAVVQGCTLMRMECVRNQM
jgi:hypothetical protein